MKSPFKPLLAGTLKAEEVDTLTFATPMLGSPKLDGIRAVVIDGVLVTRNLKPVRNKYIQSILGHRKYNGLDGELIVGSATDEECYRNTASGVMSEDGIPEFTFYVFDDFTDVNLPYSKRHRSVVERIFDDQPKQLIPLYNMEIKSVEELNKFEADCLERGYEGVMLRDPDSPYKLGRSTRKEGILLKLKRFVEDEAEIVDFQERMHNANEATINALGHTERSTHKENKIGRNDLGAILVRDKSGNIFPIGSGFNDTQRRDIWANRDAYKGRMVTFSHMEYGGYNLPRFPVFKGFREDI